MTSSSHLRALLKKNWLVWRRNYIGLFLEIVVPILCAALFLVFRYAEPLQHKEQRTFSGSSYPLYEPSIPFAVLKNCSTENNGGKVALAPRDDLIIANLKSRFESGGYEVQLFEDNQEIDDFTQQDDYGSEDKRLCLAVVMQRNNEGGENKYQYLIRFNTSLQQNYEDIPRTTNERISLVNEEEQRTMLRYVRSGFLTIQNWVDNFILQQVTSSPLAAISANINSVPVPAYIRDDLLEVLSSVNQYLLVVPLLLPFLRLMDGILREKENRIREGIKIMGVSTVPFYLSWFLLYCGVMTFISVFSTLIVKLGFFYNSSYLWVFLWFWGYSICLVSLCILISVFFNKAKIGTIAGFVFIFLLQWVGQLVANDDVSSEARFWASIAPPISVALAGNQIFTLEASQVGLTSDTVSILIYRYRTYYHYIWMGVGTVVFLILALYLDQVLPSEFGIRKHPLFCLQRKKRGGRVSCSSSISIHKESFGASNQENFEEIDPLLKTQDDKGESIIVKSLRKKYSNGKVAVDGTSFHMYSGQIFVLLGHNGAGKTSVISMLTGLYPATQGNISIFGMNIQTHLDEIRKTMGVCPQHDVLFGDLTVKEHLEMFGVFKGMAKESLAEEVNKLMVDLDLVQKQHTRAKHLSGGQKRRLSVAIAFIGGSKFILLDEPSTGMDTSARRRLWDMLKNYKHGRVLLLTTHYMDEADYLGDRIGIMGKGVMQCLGRPLFLKNRFGVGYTITIAKKTANDDSEKIIQFIQNHIESAKVVTDVSSEVTLQLPMETVNGFKLLFEGLDKNLDQLRINSYGVSVTTLEQVFLNVASGLIGSTHKQLEVKEASNNEELDDFDLRKEKIKSSFILFWVQFFALVKKRIHYFRRDRLSLVLELFLPVILVIIGVLLVKVNTLPKPIPLLLKDDFYQDPFLVQYNSLLPDNTPLDPSTISKGFNSETFLMKDVPVNKITQFDLALLSSRTKERFSKFNVFFSEWKSASDSYKYITHIDTRAQEAAPFAINKINNAILRHVTNDPSFEIEVIVSPFMHTKSTNVLRSSLDGLSISFVFAIAMSFIPASLITFIVKERELNMKHQQLVSGLSVQAYWFSNYVVDIVKYMIPAVLNCILANALGADGLVNGPKNGALWGLFMTYGFSVISFVYLTSFMFKDFGTAQTITFFFHFGTGFIGGLAVGLLRIFVITNKIARIEQWFFRIFPTFALTYGLLELTNQEIYQVVEEDPFLRSPWELDLSGGDVVYLGATAVLYLLLVFVIEGFRSTKLCQSRVQDQTLQSPINVDSDVEQEAKTIESSSHKDYSVKIEKLTKTFGSAGSKHYKVATNELSLGLKNGDCFALLGVNGSGKTTTFKMLSGDIFPTAGRAFLNQHEIPAQLKQAQHDVGYCPQSDPLLENLTAKEHLYLFAALRGIPSAMRGKIVRKLLKDVGLTEFANVTAGSYSGGNKRKLSVAIAMVGNPPIIFMDEPSSGMDPEARRFMWEVISRIRSNRKKSSILLTTHFMEEAEALSTRMCIMVDGRMRCLGSAQHIKAKYGGGYEIEIKLNLIPLEDIKQEIRAFGLQDGDQLTHSQVDEILQSKGFQNWIEQISKEGSGSPIYMQLKRGTVPIDMLVNWILTEKRGEVLQEFMKSKFEKVVLLEHFQSFYRFNIQSRVNISDIFGQLENNKIELNILQYSVRQSTLEQVFNTFAKKHGGEEKKNEFTPPNKRFEGQDIRRSQQAPGRNSQDHENDIIVLDTETPLQISQDKKYDL